MKCFDKFLEQKFISKIVTRVRYKSKGEFKKYIRRKR